MKLPTREMGEIQVLAIYERDGKWEPDWEPLRGTVIGHQFSVVPWETLEFALKGLSKPLVDALGIPPEGALRKIPKPSRVCERRFKCPLYDARQCYPTSKNMPWCYEAEGLGSDDERFSATRAIEEWRRGVYLIVVQEKET